MDSHDRGSTQALRDMSGLDLIVTDVIQAQIRQCAIQVNGLARPIEIVGAGDIPGGTLPHQKPRK